MKSLTIEVLKQIAEICDVPFPVRTVADWQEVLNIASYSDYDILPVADKINSQAPIAANFTPLVEFKAILTMLDQNHQYCKTHNHHLSDFETRLKKVGDISN